MIQGLVNIYKQAKYRLLRKLFGELIVSVSDDVKEPYEFLLHEVICTGFRATIYCKIRHYCLQYKRWWIPNKDFIIYELRGECITNNGEKLNDIMAAMVAFPDMRFTAETEHRTLENVLHAYLDILKEKTKKYS